MPIAVSSGAGTVAPHSDGQTGQPLAGGSLQLVLLSTFDGLAAKAGKSHVAQRLPSVPLDSRSPHLMRNQSHRRRYGRGGGFIAIAFGNQARLPTRFL